MIAHRKIFVDSFAGGGGASLGIKWATGRAPDIAINHDDGALAMHAANHPETEHVREDVWRAKLADLIDGRDVWGLWASPDCAHFSRAKGGKPVKKEIRSLAWIVVKWATQFEPDCIFLENVREFADWGPLVPRWACRCGWKGTEGQLRIANRRKNPTCPECRKVRGLAVTDEHVPDPKRKGITFRRFVGRLRSLGYVVQWRNLNAADYGAPTHRRRLFLIARRDGEPIEWPEPTHCAPDKVDAQPLFGRMKPWRTAAECIDWSIPCPSIFGRKRDLAEATMRRIAHGVKRYVLDAAKPFLVPITHSGDLRVRSIDDPFPTITTANRGELALVSPTIVHTAHGIGGTWGKNRFDGIDQPLGTIAQKGNHALVAAFLAKHFGGMVGCAIETPLPTTTMRGTQNQVVAANLIHMNHGDKQWASLREPLRTVTTQTNRAGLVYAFMTRYFGTAIGQPLDVPMLTATTKARTNLVTVTIDGEAFVVVDIGMRMLTPRELARAQGFPDDYVLPGGITESVARIGNSVCPHVAAAIVRANCGALVS